MFRQTLEHLADATKSGDVAEISGLNQAGVKQPQTTTGGKTCWRLRARVNKQSTEPEAETGALAKCQPPNMDKLLFLISDSACWGRDLGVFYTKLSILKT